MATSRKKKTKKKLTISSGDKGKDLLKWVLDCKQEAEDAKETRMKQNEENFDCYHLRHDWTHKKAGQSRETLSKQPMAVEQISTFFQQALTDLGDWFRIDAQIPSNEDLMKIRPNEVQTIMQRQLEKANFYSLIGNGVKSGLLGALIITKVHGEMVTKPKFRTKKEKKGKSFSKVIEKIEDKVWQLRIDLIRQENYYPDPTGEGLYEIEEQWLDYHKVKELSKGEGAIYDAEAVERLSRTMQESSTEDEQKRRETDQDDSNQGHRGRVKLTEFWGNIIDPASGEVTHENIVMTIANDKEVIRKPTPNPLWHQESPYVVAPLLEVPHAVWPKALMDSPTKNNKMLNEIYNLIVDGAMKSVNAISQIRVDALVDQSQVSDGIPAGTALKVNSKLPHGAKVAEPVITADVPQDGLAVMNVIQQEFNASALTTDLRQGVTPSRSTSATATVESSQTITSIFNGIAKNLEARWIQPLLEKCWKTVAQNFQDLDADEMKELLGEKETREIADLDPQDVFVETVNGLKFRVFGISTTLNKQQDFRKWSTLLQVIGGSDIILEAFVGKYDFQKLLGEIMTSIDIDKHKIEIPEQDQEAAGPEPLGGGAAPGVGPDQASQQPQAAAQTLESILGQTAQQQGGIPQAQFTPGPQG